MKLKFYRFFYFRSSNNFTDTKLLKSLYTSERTVQLCMIRGKIKVIIAEETRAKTGSKSVSRQKHQKS